jgi:hypothetical protein
LAAIAVVDIWNRALGKLGDGRVTSVTDQSPKARACQGCYDVLRMAELAANPWNFAIQRFQLAASATAPLFGPYTAYPLPTGWLRLLPPDPYANTQARDWIIEGQSVLSAYTAPLEVRIVMDEQDTSKFHPNFVEALAARMAWEMCEQLTQSNTKKADLQAGYKFAVNEAKKINAIMKIPQTSVEDSWITCRASTRASDGWGSGWGG